MKRKPMNKKAMFFLIGLLLFSFSVIKISAFFVHKEEVQEVKSVNKVAQEEIKEVGIVSEDIIPDTSILEKTETLESQEAAIRGIAGGTCGSISYAQFLASKKVFCSSGSGGVTLKGKGTGTIKLEKNASIVLTRVTYPLAFWLGQERYQDSNKQIKTTSPEVRSNGEQIDPELTTRFLAPQQVKPFEERIERARETPFAVQGSLDFETGPEGPPISKVSGEYIVKNADHNPHTSCEEEVAVSDYNVGKSNYIASDKEVGGYWMLQMPGGDNFENESSDECLASKGYSEFKDGVIEACHNKLAETVGRFLKIFDTSNSGECTKEELEETGEKNYVCIDPTTIAIKMTSIFGDPYECSEDGELCANAMLTDRYRATLSPEEASSSEIPYSVATACTITIDGKPYDVKCLWDATPSKLTYSLQAKDKAPKQKDFPQSFNSYWNSVKVSNRKSAEAYGLPTTK